MAGTSARNNGSQTIHYLRKKITFADGAVTVGVVPTNAIVLRAYAVVTTAFNAATTNVLDIGTSADDDGFATDIALGTIGVITADEFATSNDMGPMASDTTLTATYQQTGTAATAGVAYVVVEYAPNE